MRRPRIFLVGAHSRCRMFGRAVFVVAVGAIVAVAAGCSGQNSTTSSDSSETSSMSGPSEYTVENLAEALEAAGLSVVTTDKGSSVGFFENATRTEMGVSGGSVDVFIFPTGEAAGIAAAGVDEYGTAIPTAEGGPAMVQWVGTPHFFLRDRIIVLYLSPRFDGEAPSAAIDSLILDTLRTEMGDEFAGPPESTDGATSTTGPPGVMSLGTYAYRFETLVEAKALKDTLPYAVLSVHDLSWLSQGDPSVDISDCRGYRFANGDVAVLFSTKTLAGGGTPAEARTEDLVALARAEFVGKSVVADWSMAYVVAADDEEYMRTLMRLAQQARSGSPELVPW